MGSVARTDDQFRPAAGTGAKAKNQNQYRPKTRQRPHRLDTQSGVSFCQSLSKSEGLVKVAGLAVIDN